MPWRLATVEEQKAYERERIEEAKRAKSLDTQVRLVVDQAVLPEPAGVEVAKVVDTTKYKYNRIKVRGPDGVARYTAGNHDAIAKSLTGMSKQKLFEVAQANGLALDNHFKLRNSGHFRMIVGQALRGIVLRGNKAVIDGVEISALDQPVEWPKGYAQEDKGTHQNPIRKSQTNSLYRITTGMED